MEWQEIKISVNSEDTERANNIAVMAVPYGIYTEDYSTLEEEAWDIAHIDLIDEDLLKKDRTKSIIHIYIGENDNPKEAISFVSQRLDAEKIPYTIDTSACKEEDWLNNWKKYFKPLKIGKRLFVRPIWEENFDAENIRRTAEMLKYTSSIRRVLLAELSEPSEDFVRVIFKHMESGKVFNATQKEKLTPLVKSTLDAIIQEKVKASLDAALKTTEETAAAAEEVINTPVLGADTGVVTTQSETDAFNIIRAIASEIVAPDKVCIRDAKSYCAILFDDNNRKPICRLFFNNEANKAIVLFDGTQEEKGFIHSVEEIF